MSTFFLTGTNGFIGSNVAKALLEQNHKVRGLVRKTSNLKLIDKLKIELFYGDVTDKDCLYEAMQDVDYLIHIAGFVFDWGPYREYYDVNVLGIQNVAQIASEQKVKRFVDISTTAFYGFPGFSDIDESYPKQNGVVPYCVTKRIAEEWLFEFAKTTAMEITVIRPGNVFGPDDSKFMGEYLETLEKGKIGYVDKGRHLTCPTYIDNLVDAIIKACFEPGAVGEAFFITDGIKITWKEFTDKLADKLGFKRPKMSAPFWLAYTIAAVMEGVYKLFRRSKPPLLTRYRIKNAGRDYHFSIEKAKKILKYNPQIDIDEAVARTVDWYKQKKSSESTE